MAKTRHGYSPKGKPVKAAAAVYTTGQAAAMTGLSIQTIIRCVDAGRLRGFRVPGTRHRRVPAGALRAFVAAYGLAMPPELEPPALTAGTPPV